MRVANFLARYGMSWSDVYAQDMELLGLDEESYKDFQKKYPQLCGMIFSLKNELDGINENWFDFLKTEITGKGSQSEYLNREGANVTQDYFDTIFERFYNSLTFRNFSDNDSDSDNEKRKVLLRNEIVGRLLYADIYFTCQNMSGEDINSNNDNNIEDNEHECIESDWIDFEEFSCGKTGKQYTECIK